MREPPFCSAAAFTRNGRHPEGKDKAQDEVYSDQLLFQPLASNEELGRDLDQVHADLRSSKHLSQHKSAKPAEDLPGLGQWYCVECAKWFESEHSMQQHTRGKNHKRRYYSPATARVRWRCPWLIARRVRMLKEEPYSQKEADAAIGLLTDNGTRKPSKLSLIEEQAASLDLETTSHE